VKVTCRVSADDHGAEVCQDIESFFSFVEEERQRIEVLEHDHHQQMLFLALLDTLSKCAFPEMGNGEGGHRFVRLIDEYSGWAAKDRVSLPELKLVLEREQGMADGSLYADVTRRLSTWIPPQITRPDADPFSWELQADSRDEQESVRKCMYKELIYTLRNYCLHEFRTPGNAMPLSNDDSTPYYHWLSGGDRWELYISVRVISNLVRGCCVRLRAALEEAGRSPYDSYDFGPGWVRGRQRFRGEGR